MRYFIDAHSPRINSWAMAGGCYVPYPGDCPDLNANNILIANSENYPELFNFDLHYTFRDNFLINSELGTKYTLYFYAIGNFMSNNGGVTL